MNELAHSTDPSGNEYYLLHTLTGDVDRNHTGVFPEFDETNWCRRKIEAIVWDTQEPSAERFEQRLGLPYREVMATVSKRSPAVNYHVPFGFVLSGEVRTYYDNDSGAGLKADGTYNDHMFDFTKRIRVEDVHSTWYSEFEDVERRGGMRWNEAIIQKGAKVVGAFVDPRFKGEGISDGDRTPEVFQQFMGRIAQAGLEVLEIDARYGIFE